MISDCHSVGMQQLVLDARMLHSMLYKDWHSLLCSQRKRQYVTISSKAQHVASVQIGTLLDAIRSFDVARAQRRMADVRHMWTYDYVNAYIERRLATEHQGVPIAKAAFADDPGCDCAPGCGGQC